MNIAHLIKQKPYEKVIFLLRRHPITFVSTIFLFIILLIIPVAIFLLVDRLFPALLSNNENLYATVVILGLIYYLSTYLFFYTHFVDYYLDMWIVTNDRIVDIEQQGILSREITELDLFQIQDVTTEVKGFLGTIFNYGNVYVKTASTNTNIIFKEVPGPHKIRGEIIHLSHEDRKFHNTTHGPLPDPSSHHL